MNLPKEARLFYVAFFMAVLAGARQAGLRVVVLHLPGVLLFQVHDHDGNLCAMSPFPIL